MEEGKPAAVNLNDFTQFGVYSVFFCIAYESAILLFMVYGGFAPRLVACGPNDLRNLSTVEACASLGQLQNETKCIPQLETHLGYYCEGMLKVKQSISALILGALFGALLFGQLSDHFGRKNEFTIVQFLSMFAAGGHSAITHVFLMENQPKRHRLWVSCLMNYSSNYVLLAGIAYLARDWRDACCEIAFESPRWLTQKHKLEKARMVLRKIERINGKCHARAFGAAGRRDQQGAAGKQQLNPRPRKKHFYFYHLFHRVKTAVYVVVLSYALVTTSLIGYATVFNLEHLTGSVYLNTSLYGGGRWCINILIGFLDWKYARLGRKHLQNTFLAIIIFVLSVVIFSKATGVEIFFFSRFGLLFAAGMASQLYAINSVIISELFPTAIRNVASSFVSLFSRLGGVLASSFANFWEPLPFLVMISFIIVHLCLFNIFIPETKGMLLADHLEKRRRVFRNGADRPLIRNAAAAKADAPSDLVDERRKASIFGVRPLARRRSIERSTDRPIGRAAGGRGRVEGVTKRRSRELPPAVFVREFAPFCSSAAEMKAEEPNGNAPFDPLAAKRALDGDGDEKTKNLGDFFRPGRYTIFFCIAYEFFLLPQMLLMTFSIYSGLLPRVVACGTRELRNLTSTEACALLPDLQASTGCTPVLEAEFHSLGFEFGYYCARDLAREVVDQHSNDGRADWARCSLGRCRTRGAGKRMMLSSLTLGMGVFSFPRLPERLAARVHGSCTCFLVENMPKSLRVLVNCLISYSPQFIIQSAYLEDARETLQKIERINKTATPERLRTIDLIIEQEVIQNEEKRRKRKQYYFWIPGSVFVSTALFGVFRWSLNLIVGSADFFIQRAGRKTIYSIALSFILLMLATSAVCKILVDIDSSAILRVATSVGCRNIFNRLGAVAAPHLFLLSAFWDPLPFTVLFVLMAASLTVFCLLIPETKGCSMVDHMPERNVRVRRRNRRESMMTAHIPPSSARLTEDI
ncbi:MFS domain-containing protein [Aphelenchoides fujianensis]|nr:MFS domain-containing protein [Aphelenchoides fujianensis]